ncbi:MAG: glycosyltransferase family 2 protein [Campylobacterales bacterium]|nr:glycosyltransferase family 2 protein [Campylobacterales bacterium]
MILEQVDILLSTYNGEKYLQEQLDSIFNQSYKNFRVIVRDDGSSDNSLEIAKRFNVEILESKENFGAKLSFASLLEYALNSSNSRYFMFADQDDVWDVDKIQKSITKIKELEKVQSKPVPLLIHSDLRVVDEQLKIIDNSFWHYSKIDPKKNSFNRLLVQNTVTGCTMLINRELANLSLPISPQAIMHDWWIALAAAQFGKIVPLYEATINYRQHDFNDTGAKGFTISYIVEKMFSNDSLFKYQEQARAFLEHYNYKLSDSTQTLLDSFYRLDQVSYFKRVSYMVSSKLLMQGLLRNISLLLKV